MVESGLFDRTYVAIDLAYSLLGQRGNHEFKKLLNLSKVDKNQISLISLLKGPCYILFYGVIICIIICCLEFSIKYSTNIK